MNESDRELKRNADWVLSRAPAVPAGERLSHLAALAGDGVGHGDSRRDAIDSYGSGGAVAELEQETIEQLDKAAGLFFIKGVTAQLCVLRAHADERGTANVVIHPLSHIGTDESGALESAAGLRAIRLGRYLPFDASTLDRVTEPVAAVVVELPLRRAGYLLPELKDLRAISAWCRDRKIALHFDGARIWEAAAGYDLAVAELARLADSVYVSYYKGLGGLGGSLVAGSADFISRLAVWKTRYGGDLFTAYPYAIAARDGLMHLAPRLPEFVARARALAGALKDIPGVLVNPQPPHTNAFQLWLPGTPHALTQRHREFAAQHKVWLFDGFSDAPLSGHALTEIEMGPASDNYDIQTARRSIAAFVAHAGADCR